MSTETKGAKVGRKPIPDDVWNQVIDLRESGTSVAEIRAKTGLGLTKVYEIFRNPVRKNARPPHTGIGLDTTEADAPAAPSKHTRKRQTA